LATILSQEISLNARQVEAARLIFAHEIQEMGDSLQASWAKETIAIEA
jgi:hypothetical protein